VSCALHWDMRESSDWFLLLYSPLKRQTQSAHMGCACGVHGTTHVSLRVIRLHLVVCTAVHVLKLLYSMCVFNALLTQRSARDLGCSTRMAYAPIKREGVESWCCVRCAGSAGLSRS
jgi:hypothetical protein